MQSILRWYFVQVTDFTNSAGFRDLRFTRFPNPPSDVGNPMRQLSVIEDLLQQQVSFQAMEQQFEWKNDGRADGQVTGIQASIHPVQVQVWKIWSCSTHSNLYTFSCNPELCNFVPPDEVGRCLKGNCQFERSNCAGATTCARCFEVLARWAISAAAKCCSPVGGDHGTRTATLEAQGILMVVNLNCLVTFVCFKNELTESVLNCGIWWWGMHKLGMKL